MNSLELIRRHQLNPKRSLAQNFLVDESHLARIAQAATLTATDQVLEVGPGLGALTQHLAAQAGRVVAVELDDRLIELLQKHFADQPQVSIVHADILEVDPGTLLAQADKPLAPYKVVANLPYYITSAVLRHLLEAPQPPETIVVLIQKEVAERICATPGDMSILSVSVQLYAQPQLVHHVPASAFYPRPKVDSAVLRLDRLLTPAITEIDSTTFFRVVRAGFSQKRKQLVNTLSAGLQLPKTTATAALTAVNIDPTRRAETRSIAEWEKLACALPLKPAR